MTSAIVHVNVPADRAEAVLPCSIDLGCKVVLPPGERVQNVTIGDARYTVKVVSDGTAGPAQIIVYPSRETGAAAVTKLDVVDPVRSYAVVLEPTAAHVSRILTFTPPTGAAAAAPTPVGESVELNPSEMAYSWRYSGDALLACATTFGYRGAVWCRLPAGLAETPSVYGITGAQRRPVDVRVVDRSYLVIESQQGPFELDLTIGGTEHRGLLEHAHE